MMEQRTLDIINICKGNTKYGRYQSVYDGIRHYMADDIDVDPDYYTDQDVSNDLWEAMKDYLDHCDKPSVFMWNLKYVMDHYGWDMYHAIAVVFNSRTQVRNNSNYINGFDDRLHRLDKEGTE